MYKWMVCCCALAAGACQAAQPGPPDLMPHLMREMQVPTPPDLEPMPEAKPLPLFISAGESGLDDGRILEVLHVANVGEIDQAKLAEVRANDPRVRQLAKMLETDHRAADKKGADIARAQALIPRDSTTTAELKRSGEATMDKLRKLSGRDFDRSYLDAQVDAHKKVLQLIDEELKPKAQNAEVRTFIDEVRPTIAHHLDTARRLAQEPEQAQRASTDRERP
jgi:putative membrane protein